MLYETCGNFISTITKYDCRYIGQNNDKKQPEEQLRTFKKLLILIFGIFKSKEFVCSS